VDAVALVAAQFRVQQDLSHLFGILARQLKPLERRDQAMPQVFDPNQAQLVAPILSHYHPSSFTVAGLRAS
jgi:hypothetical protein